MDGFGGYKDRLRLNQLARSHHRLMDPFHVVARGPHQARPVPAQRIHNRAGTGPNSAAPLQRAAAPTCWAYFDQPRLPNGPTEPPTDAWNPSAEKRPRIPQPHPLPNSAHSCTAGPPRQLINAL